MASLVLAPLIIATVLSISAVAKLRRPDDAASAFTSLRLPTWLNQPFFHRALPWGELMLAVALLLLGQVAGVVVGVLAVALMLAYTVVIGRALTFGYPVDCGCFGRLGMGEVTSRTLARNILLTLIAVAGVVFAATTPLGPLRALAMGGADAWGWVTGAACAAIVAGLIVGGSSNRNESTAAPATAGAPGAEPDEDGEEALEDYVRRPTPPAAVITGDGQVRSVRDLARRQAQMLVFVSPSCGSCSQIIGRLGELRMRLGPVALRDVYEMTYEKGQELHQRGLIASLEHALFDPDRMLATALEIGGTPAAVLLGTDDLLAGGPVGGAGAVLEFITEVGAQLRSGFAEEDGQPQ